MFRVDFDHGASEPDAVTAARWLFRLIKFGSKQQSMTSWINHLLLGGGKPRDWKTCSVSECHLKVLGESLSDIALCRARLGSGPFQLNRLSSTTAAEMLLRLSSEFSFPSAFDSRVDYHPLSCLGEVVEMLPESALGDSRLAAAVVTVAWKIAENPREYLPKSLHSVDLEYILDGANTYVEEQGRTLATEEILRHAYADQWWLFYRRPSRRKSEERSEPLPVPQLQDSVNLVRSAFDLVAALRGQLTSTVVALVTDVVELDLELFCAELNLELTAAYAPPPPHSSDGITRELPDAQASNAGSVSEPCAPMRDQTQKSSVTPEAYALADQLGQNVVPHCASPAKTDAATGEVALGTSNDETAASVAVPTGSVEENGATEAALSTDTGDSGGASDDGGKTGHFHTSHGEQVVGSSSGALSSTPDEGGESTKEGVNDEDFKAEGEPDLVENRLNDEWQQKSGLPDKQRVRAVANGFLVANGIEPQKKLSEAQCRNIVLWKIRCQGWQNAGTEELLSSARVRDSWEEHFPKYSLGARTKGDGAKRCNTYSTRGRTYVERMLKNE